MKCTIELKLYGVEKFDDHKVAVEEIGKNLVTAGMTMIRDAPRLLMDGDEYFLHHRHAGVETKFVSLKVPDMIFAPELAAKPPKKAAPAKKGKKRTSRTR